MLFQSNPNLTNQGSGNWSIEADEDPLSRKEVTQRGEASVGGD
jgi:hypothetical protein